jgi:hypothetical protein
MQVRPAGEAVAGRAALSVAIGVVLFVLYALALGRGPAWLDGSTLHGLTASERASEVDTMRGYLIQIGAGILAAAALLYTELNFQKGIPVASVTGPLRRLDDVRERAARLALRRRLPAGVQRTARVHRGSCSGVG